MVTVSFDLKNKQEIVRFMPGSMRLVRFILVICLPVACLQAQNLVPNPDFETHTICPTGYQNPGLFPPYPATPWEPTSFGSPDYFHACSNPSLVGVPPNGVGWQPARSGEAYAGMMLKAISVGDYREYLTAPLIQPLIAGKYYYVSFYVSLANSCCGLRQIGAFFSEERPPYVWGEFPALDNYIPQVESNGDFLSDTAEWILIEGCFKAVGGEAFITIGNFHNNANTPLDPNCGVPATISYYFLEDVYVGDGVPGAIDVDLGNDVITCYSETLEAGITNVDYYWSTGSTESSITVNASGMYYLTVYDGCDAGVDSVYVLISDLPPVVLPPDTTICLGESLTIFLNPDGADYEWNDGSTSSDYSISTAGNFVVTLDDGCDVTSADINVTVAYPPSPFSLGDDALLCTDDIIDYSFDPDLGDFLWSNGSHFSFFTIEGPGNYSLTITNTCGEAVDEIEVEAIDLEVVMFPVHVDTLCDGDTYTIYLDPTAGTYVWQDGSTAFDYTITSAGIYSVMMSHYCGESADTILITTLQTPIINLGDTLSPCPGDTLTLTIPPIEGIYTWQDGSGNDSLSVTSSGIYTLMIENACGQDSDQVLVLYEDILQPPDLGPDFNLCPGEQAILDAGNVQAGTMWQDGSTADTLLVSSPGTYAVMISNACYSFSDTVVVGVENQAPSIALPDQITLCQGRTDTLNPGVSGVEYFWNDGTNNPTLTITAPGTYSLTITNTCGMDTATVQVSDGGPLPTVSLGVDTSVCPGGMVILNPAFSAVDTWIWPDGSGSASYAVNDSGSIAVAVFNICGQDQDTIMVGLLEAIPDPDFGADTAICSGETITLSIPNPGISIQWSDGSTGPNLLINDAGTYYVSLSNACGMSTDTLVVDTLSGIPLLDLGPDLPLCPGELLILDPGIPDVAYLWQDGSSNTTFQTGNVGTIILEITNACGVSLDTMVVYTSTDPPDIDLGQDIMECAGTMVTLESNISGVNFLWQDGSMDASFTTGLSGIYFLQVSSACGMDTDTVVVDIHGTPPVPALGPDTILCEGTSLTLLANADAETTNLWQDGSAQPSLVATHAGIYVLTQTNRCGENADSITIAYQALPPDIDLGPDTVLCEGETLLLAAPTSNALYTWQDGSIAATYLAMEEGTYSLTASNACGSTSDQILLTYDNRIPQILMDDTIDLCPGEPIILDLTQTFDASYLWSSGSQMSTITVTTPGTYAVTVSSACLDATAEVTILHRQDCDGTIYIPNVFSPNGDQINDFFKLYPNDKVEITSMEGFIYDRWGNLVFHSNAIPFIWDGKVGNEDVNPGVFAYYMSITYQSNGKAIQEKMVGDVTVLR